jgi:hypothetical protein
VKYRNIGVLSRSTSPWTEFATGGVQHADLENSLVKSNVPLFDEQWTVAAHRAVQTRGVWMCRGNDRARWKWGVKPPASNWSQVNENEPHSHGARGH